MGVFRNMGRIKSTVDSILESLVAATYVPIKVLKKHPEDFYLHTACKAAKSNHMDTAFRMIPVESGLFCRADVELKTDSFAIIMQGPIRTEDNFTVETVKYYRGIYPNAGIIVSTWTDEKVELVDKVKAAGADVLLCEKPESGGHLNINYQLKNSGEGIREAARRGYHYIAKTRTDQRILKPYVFEYLISLIKQYPSSTPEKQNQRLVVLSMNYGNMFFPYFMSDFFYFGTAVEMMQLFSITKDDRKSFQMPPKSTRREYSQKAYAPEVYIMKNYLTTLGCSGDSSIKDYWEGVSKYLLCIDMKTLDLYWPKYEGKYRLHEYYGDYFEYDSNETVKTYNMDFVNWMNLYTGVMQYRSEYEKYADVVFK